MKTSYLCMLSMCWGVGATDREALANALRSGSRAQTKKTLDNMRMYRVFDGEAYVTDMGDVVGNVSYVDMTLKDRRRLWLEAITHVIGDAQNLIEMVSDPSVGIVSLARRDAACEALDLVDEQVTAELIENEDRKED